jgi:hypothetical protein
MIGHAAREGSALRQTQDAVRRLHERHVAWMRRSGMSALLALLLIGIFVVPALSPAATQRVLLTHIAVTLLLVTGVVAIVEHRRFVIVLGVLGVVALVLRWTEYLLPALATPVVRELSTMAAIWVLAAAVGINVFASGRQLVDRIFGAIVLYLLLGLSWAVAYAAVASTVHNAFAGPIVGDGDFFEWGYFSFVTLTTVGYGDITPVSRVARSLATLEALVGQLYPAIIIARLVSLQE